MNNQKHLQKTSKSFFLWVLLAGLIFVGTISFGYLQEKKYKVELTLSEAQTLIYCLDKSTAEHTAVTSMIEKISKQINVQIEAEKPKKDSVGKKN
jgi:hypothetical protein